MTRGGFVDAGVDDRCQRWRQWQGQTRGSLVDNVDIDVDDGVDGKGGGGRVAALLMMSLICCINNGINEDLCCI